MGRIRSKRQRSKLDDVAGCTLRKSADDKKLGEVADKPKGTPTRRRVNSCTWGGTTPAPVYAGDPTQLDSRFAEKELGVLMATKLTTR